MTDFWLTCTIHDQCVDQRCGELRLYGNGETDLSQQGRMGYYAHLRGRVEYKTIFVCFIVM